MRRSGVLLVVTALLVGVIGLPGASAAKPEVVDEFSGNFGPYPWEDLAGDVISCKDGVRWFGEAPDFTVLHQLYVEGVHKHSLIQGGDVMKHQTWVGGTDYLINSETEEMITGKWHNTDMHLTTPDEEEDLTRTTIRGLLWHIVVPGYGTVFIEAGQLVLDFRLPGDPFVAFNGRSDVGAFEYDAVCAALS